MLVIKRELVNLAERRRGGQQSGFSGSTHIVRFGEETRLRFSGRNLPFFSWFFNMLESFLGVLSDIF